MFCMKCGREIDEGQVFCLDCLQNMRKYPVKPGTAIQLPKRRETGGVRRVITRRKTVTPEEQIRKLKKTCRNLTIVLVAVSVLLGAVIYAAVLHLVEKDHILPGQNYSVIESLMPSEK